MFKTLLVVLSGILLAGRVYSEDAPKPPDKPAEAKAAEAKPAEKKEKPKQPERFYPRGPEIDKVKLELGLTDDQVARAKEAVAAVIKKNDELSANQDVAAAEAEVKKAKEALKAAEEKAKVAKDNFDFNEECKKAVYNVATEEQKAKAAEILHYDTKIKAPKEPKEAKEAKEGKEGKEQKKAVAKEEAPAVTPPAPPAEMK